jgi:UrcA family protein
MSSHNTFRVARYVAACVTALTFGAAAHAADATTETGAHRMVIRYTDLDLSRDAGVRTLYARLQNASGQVCGQYRDADDLRTKRLYKMCYSDTLARAVESVDNEAVTAMFKADDRVRVASRGSKARSSI